MQVLASVVWTIPPRLPGFAGWRFIGEHLFSDVSGFDNELSALMLIRVSFSSCDQLLDQVINQSCPI